MPTLIDLLDQYLFPDAPGLAARAAIQRAWEYTTANSWDKLYLASLDDALSEELPHLSAYSGPNTQRPTRPELTQVLAAELGEAGAHLATLDQSSRAFLTELARTMQSQRLITINHHNLFTDEYRQILLNLFDHAHTRFKSVLVRSEPAYSAALGAAAAHDPILTASISSYLERQFGVKLVTLELPESKPNPPGIPTASLDETSSPEAASPEAPATLALEPIQEDFSLEPLSELAPKSEPEILITPPLADQEISFGGTVPSESATEGASVAAVAALAVPDSRPETGVEALEQAPTGAVRNLPIRLRVLLATPADVQTERRLLVELVRELDARARARFGLELELVTPPLVDSTEPQSPVQMADIFVGVVWLQFGAESVVENQAGERYFTGTRNEFARALEQGSGRADGWLRTVIYRSIRPPLDLLHLDVSEYARVQQFFERAGAYAGDDLVRVFADPSELINDARARLDAWIYNYAGDLAATLTEYGSNSAANGQIANALADYDQAIALYRELDRPEQELALWLQVGALSSADNAASAEAFNIALRLARRIEDDPAAAHALRSLGALDAARGDWERALDKYQQARVYVHPTDSEYRALLLDQIDVNQALGDAAHARGDDATALLALGNALTLSQELADAERQATLWSKLGEIAAQRGDWSQALAAYDSALAFTDPDTNSALRTKLLSDQATAHTELALEARAAGDLETAESAYQSALRANAQGGGNRQQRVAIYTALGVLATDRAEWERGIKANEQALALLDSPDDLAARHKLMSDQARTYQDLAAQRAERGELAAANSAYRDALALYQELDNPSEQASVLYQLGEISYRQDDWNQANAYFMQALTRLEDAPNTELRERALKRQAEALQHVGDDHRANNEWGQSEIAYVHARGNLEQLGLSDETGPLLYRLGLATAAQSRLPEALAYLQQARTRLTAQENRETLVESLRAQSDTLRRFADMYRGAGDFQSAQGHYRQQLELAQELEDSALEADAFHSLGLVAVDQGEWDNAVDLYEQALARLQTPEDEPARALISRHELVAFAKIGEREHAANEPAQAELAYRSALTLAQSLGDKEREADLLYILGVLAIERQNWDEALVDLRRALGIYNLMPAAANKPRVIFAIGRAQRGQKQAHLRDTLSQAESTRDAALLITAVELARELGDSHSAALASQELGELAAEESNWDDALVYFGEALTGLSAPEDVSRRRDIQRAQMNARRARAELAQNNAQWGSADADLFVALDLARELDDSLAQGELVYRRGLVAAGQEHWTQAIDLYSDALNRLPEGSPGRAAVEHAQANAYHALGNSERDNQNWAGAEAAYSQSLALRRSLNDLEPQADLMAALGDVAMRQARWSDALPHLNAAYALAAELERTEQTAALANEIQVATRALKRQEQETTEQRGDALRASRAFALALPEYTAALALAEELTDRAGQAELHAKLGFVATETGALETALEHYRVAAGMYDAPEYIAQRDALLELQAQALQGLGNRAGNAGAWQEASGYYSQSVALLDSSAQENHRLEVVRLQAVTGQNLGDQFRDDREWERALDHFRRAAGLYAIVGASEEIRVVTEREAQVLIEQAREAQQANNFVAAQTLYGQAIGKFSELQATKELVQARAEQMVSFRAAGIAADDSGDIPAARRLYRQALGIAEELHDQSSQGELYHRLGQLAARQADWTAALLSYQYALERIGTASELEAVVLADELTAHQELGTSLRIAGDLGGAESSYVRAYTNAQSLNNATRASEFAFLLGTLAADRENWESALGYYDQALGHLPIGDPQRNEIQPYRAFAFQQLGDTQRANGQFAAAASAYANATNIADEIGDETRQSQLLYRLGLLEAAQGRWEPALDAYARAQARLAGADDETATLLQRDAAFATQALKRERLAAQLDYAAAWRTDGVWEDAATAYRSALSLASDLGENELRDSIRHDLVALYAEKAFTLGTAEWWDESRDAYLESLELADEFNLTDEVAQRQDDLLALVGASGQNARTLEANQDRDGARDAYNRTLGYAREFGDTNAQATALYGLGRIAQSQGEWQASESYYVQARPLFVEVENATALLALDTDLERVQDVLAQRARQAEAIKNAELAGSEGRYDDAQLEYRTAFGLAHGLDDSPAAAALAAALVATAAAQARSFEKQGDWDRTEHAYREALGVAREFEDTDAVRQRQTELVALAVALAAGLRANRHDAQAELAYRNALDVAQEFNDEQTAALVKRDLVTLTSEQAVASRLEEQWQDTEISYRHAIEVAQEFGAIESVQALETDLLVLAGERANGLRADKAWDASENAYRHALALALEFDAVDVVRARQTDLIALATERAITLREANDWDASETVYRQALGFAQEFADEPALRARQADLIALATEHAAILREANDWDASETVYRQALGFAQEFGDELALRARQADLIALATEHAATLRKANDWDASETAYRHALEFAQEFGDESALRARQADLIALATEHAASLREANDWDTSETVYRQALGLAQEFGDESALRARQTDLIALATEHAIILREADDWDASETVYRQALGFAQEFGDESALRARQTDLIALATTRAEQLATDTDWEATEGAYRHAVTLAHEFNDTNSIHAGQTALISLATTRANSPRADQDWIESERAYRYALSLAHEFNAPEAVTARQRDLTDLAAERAAALKTGDDLGADEQAYRSALAVAEEFGDAKAIRSRHIELIALVAAQAGVLKQKQAWSQVGLVTQHQLDLAREFGDLTAQADALYALGENAQANGDLETARKYFLTAAQTYEQAEANQGTAVAQHALDQVETILGHQAKLQTALTNAANARAAGNYPVAEQEYQAALLETDALNDVPTRAATRVALAAVAFDQEQWQTSLDHYDAAGQLYEGLEQPDRVVELAQEQRRVTRRLRMAERDEARARGDRDVQAANLVAAAKAYQQGLELAQTLNDPASVGSFQVSLGQIASAEHRLDDAAVWYDTAAASFAQSQDETQRAAARTLLLTTFTALGDEHSAQAEWDPAHNSYSRAVELATQDAPAPQTAHLLARLGFVSVQQNELRHAIEYFDRAIKVLGADDLTHQRNSILAQRAQVWQQLGDAEMDALNLKAAEFAYEQALTETRALKDDESSAEALHSLGLVRGAQENWEGALDAHRESYSLVQDLGLPTGRLGILVSLAEARAHVGQVEAAAQDYRDARAIANSLSDTPQAAAIESALGSLALQQEHWQEAVTHYDAARELYTALGASNRFFELDTQQANALIQLGELLYGQGQWSQAEAALTRALELDAATNRTDRDGSLYYRRGNAASAQSEFEKAIADYDRASAALADDDTALRDRTLAQLAFALQQEGKRAQDAGDLDRAERALTRARKMAEASDNFDQVTDLWFRLGTLYRGQARHDEALAAFHRAYEFDRIDGNALQQQEISNALAERLLHRGLGALETESFQDADRELGEALEYANRANNPQLVGSTLQALGSSAERQSDIAAAIDYYARAGKTFALIKDMDRWRDISQQQATLLRQTAAHQLDANEFADAENLYRRAALLQLAAGDISAGAETHLGLGRALLAQEKFGDALIEFEQADAALEPAAAERTQLFRSFADALEAHGAQALALAELDVAQSDYSRASAYRDMLDEPVRAGLAWQQLANIALQKHDLENARSANEQALMRLDTPETMDARRVVLYQQARILSGIGDERQQNGDWGGAGESYRHALAVSQEQGDLDSLAELYTRLGTLAATQEHWDEASTEYTHALDLYDELNLPEAQAATWRRLGDMHRQALQFDRATGDYEQARELYKKAGKRVDEGAMWLRMGHVEGDRSEWDRALDQYQSALHLYNEIGAKSSKPEVYRALERAVRNAKLKSADQAAAQGDYFLEENEFVEAQESYRDALELYREANEPILLAQMQNQLGVALEGQQQNEQALAHYRDALRGFENLGIPEAQVGVLANIGDVQRQLGNWNKAEACYRQALALNESLEDATRAGELYNSLGIVREEQDDWESAFDHYRKAVSKYQTVGLDQPRVQAELNMLRARRGAQERAEQDYLRRLELARAEGSLAEAGELLNTLGLLAAEENRWSTALDYYREAVANFERLEAESEAEELWRTAQGTVLNNIGDASQQIGAWNDADDAYSRALGMAREIGDRESEAILLANLGVAAEAQQQLPRALDYNLQALESYSGIGDEAPRAELLERVGDLQLKLEQTTAADGSYRQALELALQTNENERTGRLLKQLGLLAQARGDTSDALAFYDRALERAILLEHSHAQQDLWMRQGALYIASDRDQDADRAHQAALALAIAHADESAQASLHMRLGQSASLRSDWQTALNEYQAALALYEKFDLPSEQLLALERIGDAYAALQEPVPADEAYRAALELAPLMENANVRRLWLARAALAENQNRWQQASEYLEHVVTPPDPTRMAGEQVNLMFRRGDAAMLAHQWSTADTSVNDAMELANASEEHVLYGWGMNRLGLLSQAQRHWSDALENFQEAIEIFRVNGQPLGEAHVLNNIARLKLETNDANEADLFAQAALAIAQAFDSNRETSRSLYTRGLALIETQDFEPARRFLNQAIAADPGNWAAQLQLGNTLLASGSIAEANQLAESGLGQFPDWELGAQTQLTIASLYQDDTRPFKANLKRTRSLLRNATERRNVSQEMFDAVESLLRALDGHAETALAELKASESKPALPAALEARHFMKTALLALSKSPRRFKGKQVLVNHFAVPKPGTHKKNKRRGGPHSVKLPGETLPNQPPGKETRGPETDTPDSAGGKAQDDTIDQ